MNRLSKRSATALVLGVATSLFALVPVQARQEQNPGLALYEGGLITGNLIDYRIKGDVKVTALALLDAVVGTDMGYASIALAKAAAIKIKGAEAIVKNGTRYGLYSLKMLKATPANIELINAKKFAGLAHDPSIPMDYDALKCTSSLELFLPDNPFKPQVNAEFIINDVGLSITGYEFGKLHHTDISVIELTVYRELLLNNSEEVKAAYACFDARSKTITDKKEKATLRYKFLSSMWSNYRRGTQFHPFVQKEMKRLKFSAAQKAQVTGATPFVPGITEVLY